MSFWTDGLRKTWLDKSLKSLVSDNPSTSNMINGLKNFSKLVHNIFKIFMGTCQGNSGWKSLSELYANSQNSFLIHSLLIRSIVFLTEVIYCNNFRYNYLRNEKYLLVFFYISKKKMTLLAHVFLTLQTPKNDVIEMSKKSRFRAQFDK